jgi:hypothetical protein
LPKLIKIKLKYICNFTPLLKNIKTADKKKLYCKYFFFLLLFLEYYFYKNLFLLNFYHSRRFKNSKSYLRAPNRFKSAQFKFKLLRYELNVILELKFPEINIYYFLNFFKLFNFFNSSYIHISNKKILFYNRTKVL